MSNKSFEYKIYKFSSVEEILETKNFSLKVADKAKYLVHRAIKTAANNRTQYTSSTKTKDEVRGGGVTFGPKPKSIYFKINKKEKNLALTTLIYNKNSQLQVFDKFEFSEISTSKFLKKLKIADQAQKILFIVSKPNKNLQLSIKNLPNFKYILANQLNVTDLAKFNKIILDELAFETLKETYCEKK